MQNNVTELTQKLLRSLDSNYNVTDMPAVMEVLSKLEKISFNKDLIEATRIGRYINALRKNTDNDAIIKRTKLLVKKWREVYLHETQNGQLKSNESSQSSEDVPGKKRPAQDTLSENSNAKRVRLNGGPNISEMELSDNSNSSFKDALSSRLLNRKPVIVVNNSDSNSSIPDIVNKPEPGNVVPPVEQQQPKKRGRKKGSKNHKNLLEEAETSFSNKLNVSRGNAKVKTTQELLADLHIRNSGVATANNVPSRPFEDLNERAAKLTERVSIIDQKLNANSNRHRNFHKRLSYNKHGSAYAGVEKGGSNVHDSGTVVNLSAISKSKSDDEIIVVDDPEPDPTSASSETTAEKVKGGEETTVSDSNVPRSLSVEEVMALLPPIDPSVLEEEETEPPCTCQMIENQTDFSVDFEEEVNVRHTYEFLEDEHCSAKIHLTNKYRLNDGETDERLKLLHFSNLANVNGNYGVGCCSKRTEMTENGLYVNVVPNVYTESLSKFSDVNMYEKPASENYKKYSISEGNSDCNSNDLDCNISVAKNLHENNDPSNGVVSDNQSTFREWYEVYETPSFNGENIKILPYVIID